MTDKQFTGSLDKALDLAGLYEGTLRLYSDDILANVVQCNDEAAPHDWTIAVRHPESKKVVLVVNPCRSSRAAVRLLRETGFLDRQIRIIPHGRPRYRLAPSRVPKMD